MVFMNKIFDKIITLFFSTELGVAGRLGNFFLFFPISVQSRRVNKRVLSRPAAPRPKTSRKI